MKFPRNRARPQFDRRIRFDGFTLVELLVTITIIVALAALSVMLIQWVRERARIVNAISSLRQVASFHLAYSSENQGAINTAGGTLVGPAGAQNFWERFQPYFIPRMETTQGPAEKQEILRSLNTLLNTTDADTMAGTALSGPKIFHDSRGLPIPYSFNKNIYHGKELLKMSRVPNPEQVIYAVYGRFVFTEADGKAYAPLPSNGTIPANKIFYLSDKKALAAFLDGHVESIAAPFSDRAYGEPVTTSP
ncbi:MAG: prepilin-type N-terminal cleavage/methylation domain-containing protein [Akkermansiaceae bacterium]